MAMLLLSMIGGCASVGRNEPGVGNFDQVSPALFRGAQPSAEGFRTLAGKQIKTVVNLCDSDDAEEARQVKAAGMNYLRLPLAAENVTAADAEKFLTMIQDAPAPIFVHCFAGCDRTGMAVAAYRMRVQGWSREEALRDLYAHGHYWLLYPQVKAALMALPPRETKAAPAGVLLARKGDSTAAP